MAKKAATSRTVKSARPARVSKEISTTAVRNSAIPKVSQAAAKVITHEMIAKRAYEISQSPECRSEYDNWIRAERELKGL